MGWTFDTLPPNGSKRGGLAVWPNKVPFDEELGRFYDMHHNEPGGDGGDWWDGNNLTPMQHGDHVELHRRNGDFSRWGARGAGAEPDGPGDITVEPAPVVTPSPIVEPIDPIP